MRRRWCVPTAVLSVHSALLVLQVLALTSDSWVSIAVEDAQLIFSLWRCEDCPTNYTAYTLECLANIDCVIRPRAEVCELARKLAQGRDVYIACAKLTTMACVVSSLGFIHRHFGYPGASVRSLVPALLVETGAPAAGIAGWFQLTGARFHSLTMAAGSGPILAICAAIAGALGGIGLATYWLYSPSENRQFPPIDHRKVLGVHQRYWLYFEVFPLLLASIVLQALSTSADWVQYHTTIPHFGRLQTLDSFLSFRGVQYSCIAGPACSSVSGTALDGRNCRAFGALEAAATGYLWCEGVATVALVLWIDSAVYYARGVQYGIPTANYMWPLTSVLMQLAGVCWWFLTSGAALPANCGVSPHQTSISLCAATGPALAAWQGLCLSLAAVVYTAIYTARGRPAIGICPVTGRDNSMNANTEGKETAQQDNSAAEEDTQCVSCHSERPVRDVRFELPCSHWIHVDCFHRIGDSRRNCPKCYQPS